MDTNALTIPEQEHESDNARLERQGMVVMFSICIGGAQFFDLLTTQPRLFWEMRWDALPVWARDWLSRAAQVPLTMWVHPEWHCMDAHVKDFLCRKTVAMANSARQNWPHVLKEQAA